ncbi:hypothetical protein ONZ45_g10526 [Pleurotus djamor]|nr:hypothetical protein ONZ45_g10526 [Pleurotus djamor]
MPATQLTLQSVVKLSSGYTMPLLGYGVFRNFDAKPGVLEALKAGYRHIDSAQVYGNEAQCGEAIRESGIPRGELFITSKILGENHGYENTLKLVDESLQKFGLDYLDLFLVHDPKSGKKLRLETYKALLELRDAGKIRSVGVSNYSDKHLEEIRDAGMELPTVNQLEIHPFCQHKPIVDYCNKNNIVVQAYCPLVQAVKGKIDHPVIVSIAKQYGREPAQIFIRWSLQRGFVPLPKTSTPKRIWSNSQVYDFSLDEQAMKQIDELDQGQAVPPSELTLHEQITFAMALSLNSVVKLSSGRDLQSICTIECYTMPLLGFGVYQNYSAKPAVLEAFKAGYRHVDSAQVYRNEADVGAAVQESGIPRGDVFITSKVVSKNHGYEKALSGIDESLQKFGFDYIDLFLIHDPLSGSELRIATWKALLAARDAGKVRSVGVSNYSDKHIEEIRQAGLELPAVNQVELHPFCQQKPIVEYCNKHNIVVQAYCPILRGKMDDETIQSIAKKHDRDPAHILIRWSLQRGFVPLPKSATPSRIHSNANVYDFALDEEDMDKLNGLDRGADGAISWNPVGAS